MHISFEDADVEQILLRNCNQEGLLPFNKCFQRLVVQRNPLFFNTILDSILIYKLSVLSLIYSLCFQRM